MADLTNAQATQAVSLVRDGTGETSFDAGNTDSTTLRSAANAYGLVQTSVPTAGTNANVKSLTLDALGRITTISALNAEWGQMFHTTVNNQALTGTTETPYLLFRNPNASGKSAKLHRVTLGIALANNVYCTYRFYRAPSITATGTALTVVGNRTTGQASAIITPFFAPTASANGTVFRVEITNGSTGIVTSLDFGTSFWVETNTDILITRQLSANATLSGANIEWVEQA